MNEIKPAYLISNTLVTDATGITQYSEKVQSLIKKYKGISICLERNLTVLEGSAQPILSITQFPSMQDAKEFYNSEEYAPLKLLRINSTHGGFLVLSDAIDFNLREDLK